MVDRPWSHSALANFETCARKYYELSVLKKIKEPPSEALTHGNLTHQAFDLRVSNGKPLPIGMRQFEPMLAGLAALDGDISTEQKLAINADFAPTEWFGRDVWARAVIDYLVVLGSKAMILDYKTGKRKDDDSQLSLMIGMILCHLPEVKQVTASFMWLQEPKGQQLDTLTLERCDLPMIFERFMPRVERYQLAHRTTDFPAQPGGLCRRWCPVKSCPYNGG